MTIEGHNELNGARKNCLKFWLQDGSVSRWVVKTIVDPPHQSCVSNLDCGQLKCVTAAGDQFKIWCLSDADGQWACSVVGTYLGLPCSDGVLSFDESLVACNFDSVLILYSSCSPQHTVVFSPDSCSQLCSFGHPRKVTFAGFIPDSPHILTANSNSIFIWSTTSLQCTFTFSFCCHFHMSYEDHTCPQ